MRYLFEDYALDTDRRELSRGGTLVAIEPQVFDLLAYLVQHGDRVVTKDDLFTAVWNGRFVSESALTTRLNAARTALGDDGKAQRLLRTLRGRGIRFVGEVRELIDGEVREVADAAGGSSQPLALPDRPSIAVLPFANMSSDPEQEYFADGMVEDIITELSRIRRLFVIARNSSFTYKGRAVDVRQVGRELGVRYVLEGSVRKVGDRIRITAQLLDAASGAHLWGDRFDSAIENIFALQDNVASSVAGVIEPTLEREEYRRSTRRPTDDLTAYDLYLQARFTRISASRESTMRALELVERALERDPNYGSALAEAAGCQMNIHAGGWTNDLKATRDKGIDLARRALRVAGDDSYILANAALVFGYFGENIATAIGIADRSLALNPSYARGWYVSGQLRLWAGEYDQGIEYLDRVLCLSPRESRRPFYLLTGMGHFFARRGEKAAEMLNLSLQEGSEWPPTLRFMASCLAHLGRLEEAQEMVKRLRAITTVVIPNADNWRIAEDREFYLKGLRLAAGE